MAVGNVLGRAYIEVHADAGPFARELGADIEAIANSPQVKKSSEGAGEKISEGITKGASRRIKKDAPSLFSKIKDAFSKENNQDKNFFQRLGMSAATSFTEGFAEAAKGATGLISSIGSSIGNVGSKGPFASVFGTLIVTGIPALIGLVLALGNQLGALINVVGLLPGALAIAAAAIIPITVAFQGFGDAISAIMSKDPKKIAEALKTLTPAARTVALEFQKMLPFFDQLKKVAQQKFFAQIIGSITKVQKNLGPTLLAGFGNVAEKAGVFLKQLLAVFASPQVATIFKNIFDAAGRIYQILGPALIAFINGLLSIANAAIPTILMLAQGFANALTQFGNFLSTAASNGDFKAFLDKFVAALGKLIEFGKSAYNLIETLFGGANQQGMAITIFDTILETIDGLTEFFKSERGQQALKGMVVLAGAFLILIQGALGAFLMILSVVGDVVDAFRWILSKLGVVNEGRIRGLVPSGVNALGHHRDFADGGIADRPTFGWTGEDGPEAVIPLNDPNRAREVINQAGLNSLTSDSGDVIVYIGDEQVMARVERRVGNAFKQFGRGMKYGPRPVGVGG